jgi:trehalose 6-phosphate synthase/phosphatase
MALPQRTSGERPRGGSSRLLIVSNRLPIVARSEDGHVRLGVSSGGLATGLRSWHEHSNGLWIGWPGDVSRFSPEQRTELAERLQDHRVIPVELSRE